MENGYQPKSDGYIGKPPKGSGVLDVGVSNGDRICSTCTKEDVCMYKGELTQAAKEITQISERTNVFVDVDIKCKKWLGKVVNYR